MNNEAVAICVHTGFFVADVDVEREDDEQGDQSRPPINHKHHHTAQDRPHQGHPHVVVFEAWAPPCGDRGKQNKYTLVAALRHGG